MSETAMRGAAVRAIPVAPIADALRDAGLLVAARGALPSVVADVSDDSRAVVTRGLFVAVRGSERDGHDYLAQAAERGAAAAIVEEEASTDLPRLVVRDGRRAAAVAAAAAFGWPARELTLVGVTGTNGKTTTVGILRHLLDDRAGRSASIGTLGVLAGSGGEPVEGGAGLTTPGPIELQRVLRRIVDRGVRAVAMEVSSHSLDQQRVEGLRFDAAVFTNLTRDHLDYHETMEAYFAAKASLAAQIAPGGAAVVNADDPAWSALPAGPRVVTFGLGAEHVDVAARRVTFGPRGSEWELHAGGECRRVSLPLIGAFNVANALGAAAAAWVVGVALDDVAARLATVPQVPGRLEIISEHPTVLRDYAHTPDALERALDAVRPFTRGRLIALFGAGGDRDRGKRPAMGRIGEERADVAIITSDNPRTEDPERILDDIEAGMLRRRHERVTDRREAIARAIALAGEGDVVLLAGKGHETYQVRGTTKHDFDEKTIVAELVKGGPRGATRDAAPARGAPPTESITPNGRGGATKATQPASSSFWTLDRVAEALDLAPTPGREHGGSRPRGSAPLRAVSTDTRSIAAGDLFLALSGERFDGHDFLEQAVRQGAAALVVSRPERAAGLGVPVFEVSDTLAALGALGHYRREAWGGPVVAVAGSNGKTTTKDLIRAALGAVLDVHATTGNLNNLVGVPLTLLALPDEAEVAVVEIGTNVPGEVARLRDIVRPDIAVVTSVGEEHLEGLGSLEQILREETAVYDGVAVAIAPAAQPEVVDAARAKARRTVAAGLEDGDLRASGFGMERDGLGWIAIGGVTVRPPVRGAHNLRNATLALAVARECGVSLPDAARGIADMPQPSMRMAWEALGRATLINDAYNANPPSMRAALDLLAGMVGRQRVAVLGTMRELGSHAERLHGEVARHALATPVEVIAGVGEMAEALRHSGGTDPRLVTAADVEELWAGLAPRLEPDAVILLKASRGMRLERLVPFLTAWANG